MGPEAFLQPSLMTTAVFSLLDEEEDEEAISAGPKIEEILLNFFLQKFLLSYDSFPCIL